MSGGTVGALRTLDEAMRVANRALRDGEAERAWSWIVDGLRDTQARRSVYASALELAARIAAETNRPRAMVTIDWVLGRVVSEALMRRLPAIDVARSMAHAGRVHEAADAYERAGWFAHAAAMREQSGDEATACALWARFAHANERAPTSPFASRAHAVAHATLAVRARAAEQTYVSGLAWFGVVRTTTNDGVSRAADASASSGRSSRSDAVTRSVNALEEAAEAFEGLGMRERAYDAFRAIAAVGEAASCFEHAIEGRANAARIARADHLRSLATRENREAIAACRTSHELTAAAAFAEDARAYAHSIERPNEARAMTQAALDLHVAAAEAALARAAPVALVESALRSAIRCALALGAMDRARGLFSELALLPALEASRRARYAAAAARLSGAVDARRDPQASAAVAPPLGPAAAAYAIDDLLEWERAAAPEEVCAALLLDASAEAHPSLDEPATRAVLMARLVALDSAPVAGAAPESADARAERSARIARWLGETGDYRVLSAIERLALDPEPRVRRAATEAAGRLRFKRAFMVLRGAVLDADAEVVSLAVRAIGERKSPVFIDPLARLAGESRDVRVRAAALLALVGIDEDDAADVIVHTIESGHDSDRKAVSDALRKRTRIDTRGALAQAASARLAAGASGASGEVARLLAEASGASPRPVAPRDGG